MRVAGVSARICQADGAYTAPEAPPTSHSGSTMAAKIEAAPGAAGAEKGDTTGAPTPSSTRNQMTTMSCGSTATGNTDDESHTSSGAESSAFDGAACPVADERVHCQPPLRMTARAARCAATRASQSPLAEGPDATDAAPADAAARLYARDGRASSCARYARAPAPGGEKTSTTRHGRGGGSRATTAAARGPRRRDTRRSSADASARRGGAGAGARGTEVGTTGGATLLRRRNDEKNPPLLFGEVGDASPSRLFDEPPPIVWSKAEGPLPAAWSSALAPNKIMRLITKIQKKSGATSHQSYAAPRRPRVCCARPAAASRAAKKTQPTHARIRSFIGLCQSLCFRTAAPTFTPRSHEISVRRYLRASRLFCS